MNIRRACPEIPFVVAHMVAQSPRSQFKRVATKRDIARWNLLPSERVQRNGVHLHGPPILRAVLVSDPLSFFPPFFFRKG